MIVERRKSVFVAILIKNAAADREETPRMTINWRGFCSATKEPSRSARKEI